MTLRERYEIAKAEVGVLVNGLSVSIDLVGACSFRCPSCPVGNVPKPRGGSMTIKEYRAILDGIMSQVKVRSVFLYSVSEPLLSPIVADAIAYTKQKGVKRVMISTNLSHPEGLHKVFEAGLDELRVSFSGFSLGEYFHRGRSMTQFRLAMQKLSRLAKQHPSCRVALIFHVYHSNEWELPEIRAYARSLEMDLIEERAFFFPLEKVIRGDYTEGDRELITHLKESPEAKLAQIGRQGWCYYQQKTLTLDAHGDVYLCCHVYDASLRAGNVMNDKLKDIRRRIRNHDFCGECIERGGNLYYLPET